MEKGNQIFEPAYPKTNLTRRVFIKLAHYSSLIVLFVLLASHESINPRIGTSHIDFYLQESEHLLEINSKAILLRGDSSSISLKQSIEILSNDFYLMRKYAPVWTMNYNSTENLDYLIELIDSAEYFGLPKSTINSNRIKSLLTLLENNNLEENKLAQRINLETEATRTALLLMTYLQKGIVTQDTTAKFISFQKQLPSLLNQAINKKSLKKSFIDLQPKLFAYKNIIKQLPTFIEAKNASLTRNAEIRNSDLAKIFYYTNMLDKPAFDSTISINQIIAKYQKKEQLQVSGMLNRATLSRLSEELKHKYLLIALNLDRLRKVESTSSNYLFVNIPEFKLQVVKQHKEQYSFNVIVGKTKTPTPILSSKLEKIIANPYWTVPKSITNNEMLSKIRKDSTYLQRNRYFIINGMEKEVSANEIDWSENDPLGKKYWIRQKNGWGNALGKVKFVFPNNHRVYLHDTQSKRLFKKEKRAYSHGCIRVENPNKLAQYLCDNYYSINKDSVNIDKLIARSKHAVLNISTNVEVHLQYITCAGDTEKGLVFYNDIYHLDRKALSKLFPELFTI